MEKLFGVIGDPIQHSLSPELHQFWYQQMNKPHHYHAFHVTSEGLEKAIEAVRTLNISGLNVTIPHKIQVMKYLDAVDEDAKVLGAVNTIVNDNGRLIGYNTDGSGFYQSLLDSFPNIGPIKNALILGAGGAARAVGLTLAKYTGRVDYANRTVEKVQSLAKETETLTVSKPLTLSDAQTNLDDYDLIINSTPVGMGALTWDVPITLNGLKPESYCVDLIYKPGETKWLKQAKKQGARTLNGLPMLVGQAAKAYELWLNDYPDTEAAIRFLSKRLEDK